MYLSQIPLVIGFILLRTVSNFSTNTYIITVMIYVVLMAITQLICLANLIIAAVNIANNKIASPYKFTMLAKIILIPYYVLNVFTMIYLLLPVANIFLFITIPAIIGINCTLTFLLMVGNGLHNISYLIKKYAKTKDGRYIIYAVLHFMFIIDVATAIVLFVKEKDDDNLPQGN
jgi:hypothetical protein